MAQATRENHVDVPAPPDVVWDRIIRPEGINDEMWPWLTMRLPRDVAASTVETLPLGRPVGRAWLRLFGLIPFDFDSLTMIEVQPGVRFLERSTMLSMRLWEHERTLTAIPTGTRLSDRVTLQPRLPLAGLTTVLAWMVDRFFQHRQRRLREYFTTA